VFPVGVLIVPRVNPLQGSGHLTNPKRVNLFGDYLFSTPLWVTVEMKFSFSHTLNDIT
jgi:hypothetical protein